MEPYAIGTKVRYHGSLAYMRGEYEITEYGAQGSPDAQLYYNQDELNEYYPDGVSYHLWPVGVPHKFCERDKALYYVRRGSITPVED